MHAWETGRGLFRGSLLETPGPRKSQDRLAPFRGWKSCPPYRAECRRRGAQQAQPLHHVRANPISLSFCHLGPVCRTPSSLLSSALSTRMIQNRADSIVRNHLGTRSDGFRLFELFHEPLHPDRNRSHILFKSATSPTADWHGGRISACASIHR